MMPQRYLLQTPEQNSTTAGEQAFDTAEVEISAQQEHEDGEGGDAETDEMPDTLR